MNGRVAAGRGTWLVLGAAAAAVWWAGRASLPPPPVWHPTRWAGWAAHLGPVPAVFAIGRVVVLSASLAVFLSRMAAAGSGTLNPSRASGPLSRVRAIGRLVLGLGASAGFIAGCGAAAPAGLHGSGGSSGGSAAGPIPSPAPVLIGPDGPPNAPPMTRPTPTSVPEGPPSPIGPATTVGRPGASSEAALQPTPPAPHPAIPVPATVRPVRPGRAGAAAPAALSSPETWAVRPGDSFWSIATQVASRHAASGAPASGPVVGAYWARLVAANAARLPRPGDPDLLFPGDVVLLPAWPLPVP